LKRNCSILRGDFWAKATLPRREARGFPESHGSEGACTGRKKWAEGGVYSRGERRSDVGREKRSSLGKNGRRGGAAAQEEFRENLVGKWGGVMPPGAWGPGGRKLLPRRVEKGKSTFKGSRGGLNPARRCPEELRRRTLARGNFQKEQARIRRTNRARDAGSPGTGEIDPGEK